MAHLSIFEMDFEIVSKEVMIKVKAGIFKNCIYVKGKGHTEFIADTRSRPNKVNISSEEWICPNVGIVKQNRMHRRLNIEKIS